MGIASTRDVLEHLPAIVAVMHSSGAIEIAAGGLDVDLAGLQSAPGLRAALQRVASSGTGETLDIEIGDDRGSKRRLTCRLRPLHERVLLLAQDGDERVDLTQGLDLFGMLAASVAHEVNNPLAAAIANLDLALDALRRSGDADVFEELADARDAAERVRLILRDLRMFSGSDIAPCGPVDVVFVVQSTVRVARNAVARHARIVERYGEPCFVEATDTRLGQAILTMLLLVVRSLPDGRPHEHELYVSARAEDAEVVVEIASSAPGVDLLLGPSADAVGRIVDAHGGRLELDVSVEQPPAVRFRLPLVQDDEDHDPSPSGAVRRGRVLSIDDDPTIGLSIRRILAPQHEVVCLASAEAALSLLSGGERFDVLLCDVMMPGMTGIDFFERLTREYPDQAARMIFLTGGAHSARASAFLRTSGVITVEKPFDYRHLRELVTQQLRIRSDTVG